MNLIDTKAAAKGELVPYDPEEVRRAAAAAGVDLDVEKFRQKSFVGGFVTQGYRGFVALETIDNHNRVAWLKTELMKRLEKLNGDDEKSEDRFLAMTRAFVELTGSHVQLAELGLKLTEIAGHAKNPVGHSQTNLPDVRADVAFIQYNQSTPPAEPPDK